MSRLVERLGLSQNPFAQYVAEREPDIDQYFVQPPYFQTIKNQAQSAVSYVVFGERGAGKSAARIALYKDSWRAHALGASTALTIMLDDFSMILSHGMSTVSIDAFISEIGFLTIEAILMWLAQLPETERATLIGALNNDEQANLYALTCQFYISRDEQSRKQSASQALQLIDKSRTAHWFSSRWQWIASIAAKIASATAKKKLDVEIDVSSEAERIGTPLSPGTKNPTAALFRLVQAVQTFGFSGLNILVDKVDETQYTTNSVENTARLLYPVLSTTKLLEINGLAWLFFLWSKVRPLYDKGTYTVRLDKIGHVEIAWRKADLLALLERRLSHFSSGRIAKTSEILESPDTAETFLDEAIRLSANSPRELVRLMDTIFREHEEANAGNDPMPLLSHTSVQKGLDIYAKTTVERDIAPKDCQQIIRLGERKFINRDVQNRFKIKEQSARQRIQRWVDSGVVAHTGTRPAEGGGRGQPAHEYSIVNACLVRVIDRNIALRDTHNPDQLELDADFSMEDK